MGQAPQQVHAGRGGAPLQPADKSEYAKEPGYAAASDKKPKLPVYRRHEAADLASTNI